MIFVVKQDRAHDVLAIWDFLLTFNPLFPRLKPFPLWRLEAALAPELQHPELPWLPTNAENQPRGSAPTPAKMGQVKSWDMTIFNVVCRVYFHRRDEISHKGSL
jgi:hypothetical protein